MKRSLFGAAGVVAGAALLAAVLIGFALTQTAPQKAEAQALTVSLDMDISDGPCTDIDATANHSGSYDIAICVTGLYQGNPIGSLTFDIIYDDTIDRAPNDPNSGKGFDMNPDANLGATKWGDGLGGATDGAWDCSSGGNPAAYPMGDSNPASGPGNGDAFIFCDATSTPWTLGDDETSGVIAVISFNTPFEGTDQMAIADWSYLAYSSGSLMGECDTPGTPLVCNGGTSVNGGATAPTPTNTAPPGPTATPFCGREGQPTCTPTPRAQTKTPTPAATETPAPGGTEAAPPPPPPPPPAGGQQPQVTPPVTGSGSDGVPWVSLTAWSLIGTSAILASLGGLYLRRARNR